MLAGFFFIPKNLPVSERGKASQSSGAVKQSATGPYDYAECKAGKPDPCSVASSSIIAKLGMLKTEPLRTTAIILGLASAGLCVIFLLMASIAPTLMPQDKIGEYMGLLSATTGLGGGFGLLISGGLSTLLINSIHCRVIFIVGFVSIGIATLALLKVKIPNPWELAADKDKA
jgi:hypothetical protein